MSAPRLIRTLRRLRQDDSGVSALEFAFAAPVILSMMLGSIELGYQALVKSQLESATTSAAREAISGAATAEIDPATSKPYTRDKLILKRIRDNMGLIGTINVVVDNDPTQGNPRVFVTPTASISSGGGGFARVRKPEPLTDVNGNNQCDNGLVANASGTLVRETFFDANGNNKWDSGGSYGGAGAPGDIVAYDIEVDSPLLFGQFIPIGNSDGSGGRTGTATLKSKVVVQNEIWAVAATSARIQRYCDGSAK